MMQDVTTTITKGTAGMLGSILAAVSAAQDQVAWWAGFMVAVASFTSISIDIWRKLRKRNKQ